MEKENGVAISNIYSNKDLIELNIAFTQILDNCTNMNGKFIYAMHKNIKTIKPYLDTLNVTRNEIIETLVEKDKDGKPILKEDEEGKPKLSYKGKNEEKAKSKFEEVLKTENEIHFHLINLKDWESVNGLNLNKITGLALFMDRMLTE